MKPTIEPLLPSKEYNELTDITITLIEKSNKFKSVLNNNLNTKIGHLIRSMNCYYSNLIEGHDTSLLDIEKALNNDYSDDKKKRDLQLEAKSHILVQEKIDNGEYDNIEQLSQISIQIHHDFYSELPKSLHKISNENKDREIIFEGGSLRNDEVKVGNHIPPIHTDVQSYLNHFNDRYVHTKLNKMEQIYSIPASHHRFCWIHPFFDGNGRVARLFSHYMLKKYNVGSPLWSISRGLARSNEEYKQKLQYADTVRQGDLDGRGNLSEKALVDFMIYFINACIDQIDFMEGLLTPTNLLKNIEVYTYREIEKGNLKKGSFNILREAFYNEKVSRGKAPELTGYKERSARDILKALQNNNLIVSETEKQQGDFSINLPASIVDDWFPKLN